MSATSVLRFAQVVRVEPEFRTCEVVFMDDGWRQANVPILSMHVASDCGGWTMHNMPRPPSEPLAGGLQPNFEDRQVMAVVAMIEGNPVVLGFQPHPLAQLMFVPEEQNRDIWRHPSGTIVTINKNGSLEVQHTGGMFLRIATELGGDPVQHEDLTPLAANENWLLPFNDPPTVTLSSGEFRLVIRPNGDTEFLSGGNLTMTYNGNGDFNFNGDVSARISGSLTASAGADATVQAVGSAHLYAGASAVVAAGGDASVRAAGSVSGAAGGSVLVASAGPMTLAAPEITALTDLFYVTGYIVEGESIGGGETAAAMGAALGTEAVASGVAAAAAAGPEVEAAIADAQFAVDAGIEAERVAIETSLPAIGLGEPDNLGEPINNSGTPAG